MRRGARRSCTIWRQRCNAAFGPVTSAPSAAASSASCLRSLAMGWLRRRGATGGRGAALSRQRLALASELAEALPAEADVSIAALDAALQQQTAARAERQGLEDEVRKTTAGRERLRGEVDAARWKLSALSQRAEAAAKAR